MRDKTPPKDLLINLKKKPEVLLGSEMPDKWTTDVIKLGLPYHGLLSNVMN